MAKNGETATLLLMNRLALIAEKRDGYTAEHLRNVSTYSAQLAHEAEVPLAYLISLGAAMHDIGKIDIIKELLIKPGRLEPAEKELVNLHSAIGYEILANTGMVSLNIAAAIARHHHERWDGDGYPDRLAGEGIPLSARVVSLADAWDAMTSDRPYRPALPRHIAAGRLHDGLGTQFDPELGRVFIELIDNEVV